MPFPSRRQMLNLMMSSSVFAVTAGLARSICAAVDGCEPLSPITVGAIRWDAWYESESIPGKAVERALSPDQYRFRLPFFAAILPDGTAVIDGDDAHVMEREIGYAVSAGLAYWAFVAYDADDPMSNALHLFLANSKRSRINFCMLSVASNFTHERIIDWHISLMVEPGYQTVLDGRPLYYLGFFDRPFIDKVWGGLDGLRKAIDQFRASVLAKGLKTPYIVCLSQNAQAASAIAEALGLDALSAYAISQNMRSAPFEELMREARAVWTAQAATGLPVVPVISTGWDRRPRIEHPVPWEPRKSPPSPDEMMIYYETATPAEIERAIEDCLAWMAANPQATPAQTALLYAWNENDEGGWLIPTYPDNRERIDAAHKALCSN